MSRSGANKRGGHRTSTQLNEDVRTALEQDPAWQHFTRDERWVCPYCLTAVRSPQTGRAALMRAIDRHLHGRCPHYRGGKGQVRSKEELRARCEYEDIANLAMSDRAWQVFDHEGYWYSPSTLQRVESVRIHNRRFDSYTIQRMVDHLMRCPEYPRGVLHSAAEVQQARDRDMRARKLASNITRLLSHSIWRYCTSEGRWVCPYCLDEVPSVTVPDNSAWPRVAPEMARHLLEDCPSFGPQSQVMHRESEVARAAGQDAPSSHNVPVLNSQEPSAVTLPRVATPINDLPSTHTPSTGQPARDEDSEPTITPPCNPVATPLGNRRQSPPPRVATPLPDPNAGREPPSRVYQSPRRPSDQQPPPRVATPLPEPPPRVATPLPEPPPHQPSPHPTDTPAASSGEPSPAEDDPAERTPVFTDTGEQALAGSLLDQLDEGDQAAMAGGDHGAETAAADEDDPLAWMEEEDFDPTHFATPDESGDSAIMRARDMQQKLLREAPDLPGYTFATRYEAAEEISGDFYEFIRLPDGRIGFAQGDVSGHGVQAGLIMSMAKKVLAIYARQGSPPKEVLAAVNDALAEDLGGKMFVTITYAILDPSARTITWARAGHNPTIRFNRHSKEISEIKPGGMVVGMKSGPLFAKACQEETTQLRPGDLFLVYTDGVTETMNRQGEEYDVERLQELIQTHGSEHESEHLLDRILDSLRGFRGGKPVDDDITLLALDVD